LTAVIAETAEEIVPEADSPGRTQNYFY